MALENRSPPIDGVLGALLAKLEKDKPSINIGEDDKLHCENFAVRVFTRADKADRAGRADKNTATTYYAASIFIEVGCHAHPAMRQLLQRPPSIKVVPLNADLAPASQLARSQAACHLQ